MTDGDASSGEEPMRAHGAAPAGLPAGVELSRLLASVDVQSVSPLGSGVDHHAFCINDDLVLRCAIDPDRDTATRIRSEVALLAAVAERSPVPVPAVVGCDPEAGLLLLTLLPGNAVVDVSSFDRTRLVDQLGPFLDALHSTPPAIAARVAVLDDTTHAEYREEARTDFEAIAEQLPTRHRSRIVAFLDKQPPSPPPAQAFTLCHSDLGAEHILVSDRSEVTGVIDWSDSAITDRARDYGRLVRDLGLPTLRPLLADASGDDRRLIDRALFHARCSLIEDLRFGLETGNRRYSDAAASHIAELL